MNELTRYTYHRVFDGYNFLSRTGVMEEIVGCDMELVSAEDYDTLAARVAELERGNECLHSMGTNQSVTIANLEQQLATVTAERDEQGRLKAETYARLETAWLEITKRDLQLASLTPRWTTARPTPKDFDWWLWRPDKTARPYAVMFHNGCWHFGNTPWVMPTTGEWAGPILEPEEDTHS